MKAQRLGIGLTVVDLVLLVIILRCGRPKSRSGVPDPARRLSLFARS